MSEPEHPIQPLVKDVHGTVRFKANAIVCHLLNAGSVDMNRIACMEFSQNDREQFAQLIGYSLSGFGELGYVRNTTYDTAAVMAMPGLSESQAKIRVLEDQLARAREAVKQLVPALFNVAPEDLAE